MSTLTEGNMIPSLVILELGAMNLSGPGAFSSSMDSGKLLSSHHDFASPLSPPPPTPVETATLDDEDDEYDDEGLCSSSDSPSRVSEELVMTASQLEQLHGASSSCIQLDSLHQSSSSPSMMVQVDASAMPMIRRNLSLDSAQDMIAAVVGGKPSMIRRWTSAPPQSNMNSGATSYYEQSLRERRYECESLVKRLYEERKEKIMEIFQNTWVLSDPLEDEEEEGDDDEEDCEDDGANVEQEEEEDNYGEEEDDDG